MRYTLDVEFDCVNGPLISMALVREDGLDIYILTDHDDIKDPWVVKNIIPIIDSHNCKNVVETTQGGVGVLLRDFLFEDDRPVIISDSTADIGYFTRAYGSTADGQYRSLDKKRMTFVVERVNPYPTEVEGLVQHNAWADAMALKYFLEKRDSAQIQKDINLIDSIHALMKVGRDTDAQRLIKTYRESHGAVIFEK